MKCWLTFLVLGMLTGCARFESRPLSPNQTVAALENRSLEDPQLRVFLETNRHSALPDWPLRNWDFETLTLAAFYLQPSLEVARAQWQVAEAAVQTAGGRPNPVLSLDPGYTLNPGSGVSPWIPLTAVDIPIETAGKRGYRIAQAQHLATAARLKLASVAWQVRSDLRSGLLDCTAAQRRAELLRTQLQAQRQVISLLEQRVQAGATSRNALTPQRIALAKAEADLADATRQFAESRVRIAQAIGVPVKAIQGLELSFPVSGETKPELTSTEARQQALLGRPDILAALAEYAASESALQLEIAKQYPDVHLNPSYQYDQGEHKWSLGVAVELPVLNQNQGPIAEARARRVEAGARFVELQAKVIGEIDSALAALDAALDQLSRHEQLARLAHDQLTATEAMLQAGAADRLDLASAQLESSLSGIANLDTQIKVWLAMTRLEDALQRPLESWPALEQGHAPSGEPKKP